jgi:hypothetical protein
VLKRFTEDFLTGCTTYLAESFNTDVDKAGRSAANQILYGLRAGFYAEIVTHEQKFENMTMDEWDNILKLAGQLTRKYEKIYMGHDNIGCYLKGKDGVWINSLNIYEDGVQCILKGKTDVPLNISVFRDEDEYVVREYKKVECFDGKAEMNVILY